MGSVKCCLEGVPEKGLVGGCWRAGEERPNPEKLSLWRLAVESYLGSFLAGLYTPQISGWSRQNGRSEFLLAAGMGCCDSGEEVKLWGCFFPGSRLDSWKVIGWWPRLGRYAGSPAGWISIGWQRRRCREVSCAGRWIFIGCCRCPSLPSPTWPQASGKPRMSFWRRRGDGWRRSRRG